MNDCSPTDETKCAELLEWIRDYGARRVNSLLIDTRRSIPPYVVLDFGNAGVLGLQVPKEWGGLGLSYKSTVPVLQQLAAMDIALATFVVVHNFLGIRPIMLSAPEPLRAKLLPDLARGRTLGAFAITEPGAGSNPAAIQGSAVKGADGRIRLNATKMWIGNASWAGVINVFARYTDEHGRPQGSCGAVVPIDSPGLSMGPELLTMGMRGMVQNMVRFDDVELHETHRLGAIGEGLAVAHATMMMTRLALGAISLGAIKRCLQLMTRYASRRTGICAGRLLDNPVSRWRISLALSRSLALEALIAHICDLLDRNEAVPEELLVVAKAFGTEYLWQTADWAIQMLGGRGYLESNVITQIMRDARVGRIFEGPTETLVHHIGSRLMLDDATLRTHLAEVLGAQDIAEQLSALRDALKERSSALTEIYPGRQARDYANSLLGQLVANGILYAVARKVLAAGSADWAVIWAKGAFEAAMADALNSMDDPKPVLSSDAILGLIEGLESDIGNIEQSLPAEEWRLDPYVRVDDVPSKILAW
jgi:alkylation response protein AidB-like acyl-CoA dehydrogenase